MTPYLIQARVATDRGFRKSAYKQAELKAAQGRGPAYFYLWEWTVPADALPAVRAKSVLCASLRRPDGVRVRVVAREQPDGAAQPVSPTLEDAYTWLLGAQAQEA